MVKRRALLALLPLLLLAGCKQPEKFSTSSGVSVENPAADALASAQLGELDGLLSEAELAHVHTLVEQLLPLRQAREGENRWRLSTEEANLVDRLNRLYERYTLKYLGGGGSWGYASPAERPLADYAVEPDGGLRLTSGEDIYRSLWAQVNALLPEGALDGFSRFTVFTDGLDETLAYVSPLDDTGTRWELAVDPADAGELDWFTETVLHEYTHYLTLNDTQADYGAPESGARYCEEGMVARSGSYLDDFYHAFWTDYLHDRLANPDSYGFYLRHQADFVTDYASTDPSEDIAESFTYFVLWDAPEGDAVWEEKLNFFYRYPELGSWTACSPRRSWPTCIPLWNSSSPCAKPGRGKIGGGCPLRRPIWWTASTGSMSGTRSNTWGAAGPGAMPLPPSARWPTMPWSRTAASG